MSETANQPATSLTMDGANYPGNQQWPAEANTRLLETDFARLLTVAQNALDEFAWAVDNTSTDIKIVGLVVVGTFLTEDFNPHQSDLDIYLLTDQEYEHEGSFCRMLLDPQSAFREQFYDAVPQEITYVDPLGLTVAEAHRNIIRSPSLALKVDSKENSNE